MGWLGNSVLFKANEGENTGFEFRPVEGGEKNRAVELSAGQYTAPPVQTEVLRTSLVYEVRVLVDDPDDALRLGQPVTVRLESGTADRNHEAG